MYDEENDENDLTDMYRQITGRTLADDWENNPDPPPNYGQADPRLMVEVVNDITWIWHTMDVDEWIEYTGDSVEVKR